MSYPKGSSVNNAIPSKWTDIHGFEGEFCLPTHDSVCAATVETEDPVMFIIDLKGFYM